jgi:hypothetical protein
MTVMFYVEDTANVKELVQEDDHLLILDGTTCLDYLNDETDTKNGGWFQSIWDSLKNL